MSNGIEDAIKTGRKLNLKDVEVDFKKFNFIINTNDDSIDTTNYAQAHHSTTQIVGAYNPDDKKGWLVLSSSDGDIGGTGKIDPKEKRILIFEETVRNIIIKSKRNFLNNQKTK